MKNSRAEDEKGFTVDSQKRVPDLLCLIFTGAAVTVMLASGFNQLPPFVAAMSALASLWAAVSV